jgi:hypothetical protein
VRGKRGKSDEKTGKAGHLREVFVAVPLDAGQNVTSSGISFITVNAGSKRYDKAQQDHGIDDGKHI